MRNYESEWFQRQAEAPPRRECETVDLFLWEYANSRDPALIDFVVKEFGDYVQNLARKNSPASHVEDVVQETWLRVLSKYHKYDRFKHSAKTWIGQQFWKVLDKIKRTEARYVPLEA